MSWIFEFYLQAAGTNRQLSKRLASTWVYKSHQRRPPLNNKCLFFLSFLVCLQPRWSPLCQHCRHKPKGWRQPQLIRHYSICMTTVRAALDQGGEVRMWSLTQHLLGPRVRGIMRANLCLMEVSINRNFYEARLLKCKVRRRQIRFFNCILL